MLRAEGAARTPGGLPPGRGRAKRQFNFTVFVLNSASGLISMPGRPRCVYSPRRF